MVMAPGTLEGTEASAASWPPRGVCAWASRTPQALKAKPAEPAAQPRMMSLRDWYVACGVISLGVSC
jgi:hypothetical protein